MNKMIAQIINKKKKKLYLHYLIFDWIVIKSIFTFSSKSTIKNQINIT